jgi:hypothetical protein
MMIEYSTDLYTHAQTHTYTYTPAFRSVTLMVPCRAGCCILVRIGLKLVLPGLMVWSIMTGVPLITRSPCICV